MKKLKYPKEVSIVSEVQDEELYLCPIKKKRVIKPKYNIVEAYDTHLPIKKRSIKE